MYYRDVKPEDEHFEMVQVLGLKGYLPEWEVKLNEKTDAQTILAWEKLSGKKLTDAEGKSRKEILLSIYNTLGQKGNNVSSH
jgi:hypothetical protein